MVQGRYSHRFFTKHKILYDRLSDDDRSLVYIFPKKTTLKHRLATDDALFVDFVSSLLQVTLDVSMCAHFIVCVCVCGVCVCVCVLSG